MDIGTNSIRLLLVRLHPNHSHTILTELDRSYASAKASLPASTCNQPPWSGPCWLPKSLPNWHAPMGQTRLWQWPRQPHAKPIIRPPCAAPPGRGPTRRTGHRRAGGGTTDLSWCGAWRPFRRQAGVLYRYWRWQHGSDHGDQHQYAYVGSLKLGAIRLTTHFLTRRAWSCATCRSTTPSNATCATMPCARDAALSS